MKEFSNNWIGKYVFITSQIFSPRNDRVTIQDREKMYEENEMSEEKAKKLAEERKRVSTKVNI